MDDVLADELLPLLSRAGDTVVVFTADHGEEFWEHGIMNFGHGRSVYDTLVRVPMAIRVPGAAAGRDATPASHVDLAPTLLALAGVRAPATMQGRPFLNADGSAVAREPRPVFVGSSFFTIKPNVPPRRDAAILWPRKLIVDHERPDGPAEYYDLAADPAESRPLPEDATARELRVLLKRWREANVQTYLYPEHGGAASPDLKALGYIK
jgi:arylsulfatase A-like enzyme